MSSRSFVVVKTGSTVPSVLERRGDFEEWIAEGLGVETTALDVVPVFEGAPLPAPGSVRAAVVTGSPAFVSDREDWSVRAGSWLVELMQAGSPILGICYGHQLLAQALGGQVGRNPRGRTIGNVAVDRSLGVDAGDPLLGALPARASLHVSHVESVLEPPAGSRLLATSTTDPNHALAFGPRAWGVQWHPEFDADIVRGYVETRTPQLLEEGIDPAEVLEGVVDSGDGKALLRRFGEIAAGH